MKYRQILIAGGCGFIGSSLGIFLKNKYPCVDITALDNLKRRGSELNLARLKDNGIRFVHGDVRNPEDLSFERGVDLVIECSAEPSVIAGMDNPVYMIHTNMSGAVNCLELCRRHKADIVFLSTSRVYPYRAINNIPVVETGTRLTWKSGRRLQGWSSHGINEEFTTQGPKTLYGATKLSSEMFMHEYMDRYGIRGVINRCGVIAGPWQFGKVDQGVFTLWMLAHYFKRSLHYIGFKGKQVRDILHVSDLCRLIDLQISDIGRVNGKVFNVGGGLKANLSLLETTNLCRRITGNKVVIKKQAECRPGDVGIFITDTRMVQRETGWHVREPAEVILDDIYRWICVNERQIKKTLF
ncbi:MAG: NAD-dependent epimerase/dehydratase family protein [Candidatus Omnitrophota bacterium]